LDIFLISQRYSKATISTSQKIRRAGASTHLGIVVEDSDQNKGACYRDNSSSSIVASIFPYSTRADMSIVSRPTTEIDQPPTLTVADIEQISPTLHILSDGIAAQI
jgi:hypothetical protein